MSDQHQTNILVTGKRLRNLVASSTIDINLKGRNIERVTDFKLLGVTLDHDLSFNRQIEELCKKLAKRIGLLRHISPYFKRSRRDIYYSRVITPIMLYGSKISCVFKTCGQNNS